jgi:hypothetical protein
MEMLARRREETVNALQVTLTITIIKKFFSGFTLLHQCSLNKANRTGDKDTGNYLAARKQSKAQSGLQRVMESWPSAATSCYVAHPGRGHRL